MKGKVLVLNKFYYPVDVEEVSSIFGDIWSKSKYALDIHYEQDDNGNVNTDSISYTRVVDGFKEGNGKKIEPWEEWCNLPIRPYDEVVQTTKGPIRKPNIVVCGKFDRVPFKRGSFPTKSNIIKRDKGICQFTGIVLPTEKRSVDHIFPVSRCFDNPNTWENQVCAHRELNTWKADRLPEECDITNWEPDCPLLKEWKSKYNRRHLKLINYPTKPKNMGSFAFSSTMESWDMFLKNV